MIQRAVGNSCWEIRNRERNSDKVSILPAPRWLLCSSHFVWTVSPYHNSWNCFPIEGDHNHYFSYTDILMESRSLEGTSVTCLCQPRRAYWNSSCAVWPQVKRKAAQTVCRRKRAAVWGCRALSNTTKADFDIPKFFTRAAILQLLPISPSRIFQGIYYISLQAPHYKMFPVFLKFSWAQTVLALLWHILPKFSEKKYEG